MRSLKSYFRGRVGEVRSRQMSRIQGKDTKPELLLRKAVHASGGRFRIHVRDLPGHPDLANKRAKVAVFVDGCFWHGCPRHFKVPKVRREFWAEKIRRNQEKRTDVRRRFPDDWQVIEVFECELKEDQPTIVRIISKRLERPGR